MRILEKKLESSLKSRKETNKTLDVILPDLNKSKTDRKRKSIPDDKNTPSANKANIPANVNGNVPNDGFRIPKKSNATSGSSFQKGNNYRKPGKKQSKDVTMPKRGSFPPRGGKSNRAWRKGKKFNDVSEDTSRWTSDSFFPKMGKDN